MVILPNPNPNLFQEEYVVAGSDSGHMWIWDSKEGNLAGCQRPSERTCSVVNFLKADEHCCNGVSPHPFLPILSSYGIEKNAKLWGYNNNDDEEIDDLKKMKRVIYSSDMSTLPLRLEDSIRKMRKHSIRRHTIHQQIRRPVPVFDLKQYMITVRSIRKRFVQCKDINSIAESCRSKFVLFETSGLWLPALQSGSHYHNESNDIGPAFPSDYLQDLENNDEHFSDQDIMQFLQELCKENIISDEDSANRFLESLLLIQKSASKYSNPRGTILPYSEFSYILALFKVSFYSKAKGNVEFKEKKYEQSLIYYR